MEPDFATWRAQARDLLTRGIAPEHSQWPDERQGSMFGETHSGPHHGCTDMRIPAPLMRIFEDAFCHREPRRLPLLYRVLWRATHGEPRLVDDITDDDMAALLAMQREVRHDIHRMHAFVRFREIATPEGSRWIARYEPQHHVVRRAAPFFVERFGAMAWTIVTSTTVADWDGRTLDFLDPEGAVAAPAEDAAEALWLTYYRSIFNPARVNVRALDRHLPRSYRAHLPEAVAIPALVASAAERTGCMLDGEPDEGRGGLAVRIRPQLASPSRVDGTPDTCRRCPLWEHATQAVPGVGRQDSDVMIVGEQPGDEEDLQGKPFVGPAGQLLRRAMRAAGIDAGQVYVTNAVKHFSWTPRGKRRIHKTPTQRAIAACRDWLEHEIANVKPRVIVALGATALESLLQARVPVGDARERDDLCHASGARIVATWHPAAVLRAEGELARERFDGIVSDLRRALLDL